MNIDIQLQKIKGPSLAVLVIALIYFVSLNYDLTLDGAETTYFGSPLPWNSKAPAASLGKEIYILPLVLNVLFWMWMASKVLQFIERLPTKMANGFRIALFTLGIVACGLILLTLAFNELFFSMLPAPAPFHITAVRPGFGF
ncbi:MAG: hypothetical protein K2X55_27765 [Burkholderiaceae bacterium]|nr:hypothetical protein [Burkholderiaceae bacterium]